MTRLLSTPSTSGSKKPGTTPTSGLVFSETKFRTVSPATHAARSVIRQAKRKLLISAPRLTGRATQVRFLPRKSSPPPKSSNTVVGVGVGTSYGRRGQSCSESSSSHLCALHIFCASLTHLHASPPIRIRVTHLLRISVVTVNHRGDETKVRHFHSVRTSIEENVGTTGSISSNGSNTTLTTYDVLGQPIPVRLFDTVPEEPLMKRMCFRSLKHDSDWVKLSLVYLSSLTNSLEPFRLCPVQQVPTPTPTIMGLIAIRTVVPAPTVQ